MTTAHIDILQGKTGRIYVARKGTQMVFVLDDGNTYMTSCTNPTNTMVHNPVPGYWQHSIDWAAGRAEYVAFGMSKDTDNKAHYPAAKTLTDD